MAKLDITHEQHAAHAPLWAKCRDAIAGQHAVHMAGEAYLPKLSGQTMSEYRSYVMRAPFFNAAKRTLDSLSGLIAAKQAKKEIPAAMTQWLDDITLEGTTLDGLAFQIIEEQIAVGRVGLIVEHPSLELDAITVGVAESLNLRPYIRIYRAESIHDWRTGSVGGLQKLTMVKLYEVLQLPGQTEFETIAVPQYRILDLFEGAYRVRLFRQDGQGEWLLTAESFPRARGQLLTEIPFVIINASSCGAQAETPPLLDLIDQNLAHYRNTADLEHGLHFTGLPTAVLSGVQLEPGQTYAIGSTAAWVFPDPAAKAEYLEFQGAGLTQLMAAIKEKENRMAVLGARMLSDDKKAAESSDTMDMRTSGERSVLASMSRVASMGLTAALRIMAQWAGVSGQIEYALNRDFGMKRLGGQELTALVGAWQAGAFSQETLFDNLSQGQIITDGKDFETEMAQIADAAPTLTQGTPPSPQSQNGLMARLSSMLGV